MLIRRGEGGEPWPNTPSPDAARAVGPVSRRVQLWSERRWSRRRRGGSSGLGTIYCPRHPPNTGWGGRCQEGEVAGWPQNPRERGQGGVFCSDGEGRGGMQGCVLASESGRGSLSGAVTRPGPGLGRGTRVGWGNAGAFCPPPPRAHACPRQAYHTAASLSSGLGCESPPL